MNRLEIQFAKQGDLLIFDMGLDVKAALKELFPHAKPLRVILGFQKKSELEMPQKSQVINHLLPMLTGLEKEDLKKISEFSIMKPFEQEEVINIKAADV